MAIIAVIGAGSWGTALALSLSNIGHAIRLWAHEDAVVESIRIHHENFMFLPGIPLPEGLIATTSLPQALDKAEFVLTVMPSHFCRSLYERMLPALNPEMVFISATKGLEVGSLMRMSEVIRSAVAPRFDPRLTVLSGPSFAREVAIGDPTAVVVASQNPNLARCVQKEFSSKTLRLYTSSDEIGVELGGAVKNVIALAAGVIEGLGLGHNPKAALITRGLVEMVRLACACGARSETLAGLAGMGDLVLTCTGSLSRNRHVGVELGRGRKLSDILRSMHEVAEGVMTTEAAVSLAHRHKIEMPISRQVQRILHDQISPRYAIRELMERTLKNE
jgi:glycerol-3-phosphate dehydrogenase (NAD(P)+)